MTPAATATDDLAGLKERLEKATRPDREIDVEIAPLMGLRVVNEGHPLGRCCYNAEHRLIILPNFTASIDAAVALVGRVLPEWHIHRLSESRSNSTWTVQLWWWEKRIYARAKTPPIALCLALVSALTAKDAGGGG